ncbi:hypothetical protein, partial [Neisseria bacilliformis]
MHAFPAAQRPSENPQPDFQTASCSSRPPQTVCVAAPHTPDGRGRLKKQKTGWKSMPILFFAFFRRPFFQ